MHRRLWNLNHASYILPWKFILAREAWGNNLYCFIPSSLVAKHEFQYIEIGLQQWRFQKKTPAALICVKRQRIKSTKWIPLIYLFGKGMFRANETEIAQWFHSSAKRLEDLLFVWFLMYRVFIKQSSVDLIFMTKLTRRKIRINAFRFPSLLLVSSNVMKF